MRRKRRGKVPPRRRADDADPRRVDFPLGGARTHEPHGARGVLEHPRVAVARAAEAVFQNKTVNPLLAKKLRVTRALVGSQPAVGAAGKNHEHRATGLRGVGEIRGERRDVLRVLAECSGSTVRPERDRIGGSLRDNARGEKEGHAEEDEVFHFLDRVRRMSEISRRFTAPS